MRAHCFLAATMLAACAVSLPALAAPSVLCHYTYGGETQTLRVAPVSSPYTVPAIQVGSYFLLRVVFQTEPAEFAAVKVYAYAAKDEGPAIIHQASYAYPVAGGASRFGFTGEQRVYEPVRDGELIYWCEMAREDAKQ